MKKTRFPAPSLAMLLLLLIVIGGVLFFMNPLSGYTDVPTSRIVQVLDGSDSELGTAKIKSATMVDGEQEIRLDLDDAKHTHLKSKWVTAEGPSLVDGLNARLKDGRLAEWHGDLADPGGVGQMLMNLLIIAVCVGGFLFMFSSAQGGGGRVMNFGKSKAKIANKDMPKTTFADVAGADEATEELQEIKEFLAEPAKFQAVGAKIPKGVLLYGQPGTGKTLLARAVAGEAGVPFFSISGSDFVEMFVGVGASRVRDLFEQAKENAPAIIFIDEIDAVGRHRGAGMGGGHDEREQTLNQLLVEMDGFDSTTNVILIAATNRPDVLDPALLRPGRFDRQISVDAPDLQGRYQILQVHAKGKPLGSDVDLASIARRTPGFTGADLANVLNEAALLAARTNLRAIGMAQLDEAIDRVVAGPQKKSRLMDEHEKLITAYHEGGHALVAAAMPGNDPVQKITILPRGRALGYTMVMPDEDKYSQTRGELLDQLAYMLGGRAAEELIFHDPTTGASNDIEKATKVARAMVTQYGMSERIGAVQLGSGNKEPFMGMDYGSSRDYSEEIAGVVDEEVKALINTAHQEAFDALSENREVLDELVRQLFEHETLDKEQVLRIFEPLKRREPRGAWTGSPTRVPSDVPPVMPPPTPKPAVEEPRPTGGVQLPPGQTPPPQLPPQQWPGDGGPSSGAGPDLPGGSQLPGNGPGTPGGPSHGWPGGPQQPQPPSAPGPAGWPGTDPTPQPPTEPTPGAGPSGWPGADPQPPSGASPWSSGPGIGGPQPPEPPSTGSGHTLQ